MSGPGHVYLTGLSGSGKSTVAPLLAQRLGLIAVDTDRAIEARAQLAIHEIFARHGEHAFRDHETAVIDDIARGEPSVIALGGGALLAKKNRTRIRATGTLVYLEAHPHHCAARLTNVTTEHRPLVAPGHGERLEERLAVLYAHRRPLYEAADVVIDANDGEPHEIAERVAAALAASART